MLNPLLILFGKAASKSFRVLNLGNGSTWPGHIALKANKKFIRQIVASSQIKIIIIAGTNGKTTTAKLIHEILKKNGNKVLLNESGANLLNGIASTLLLHASVNGKLPYDYAIFESDENALPHLLDEVCPDVLILLNLFRDQLDRYGEVHSIAERWQKSVGMLSSKTHLLLNADDPEIAYLGTDTKATVRYFGLKDSDVTSDHAADSVYCPVCHTRLEYKKIYYSHLGDWRCDRCKFTRPSHDITSFTLYPLAGIYNRYNTHAAVLATRLFEIDESIITTAFRDFTPAFGRQEMLHKNGRNMQIFLSKNPTSFNQSLRTIHELHGKNLLIVLNDGIADGRDISWIWDTEIESYTKEMNHITLSGSRCFDMALRFKYAEKETAYSVEPNLVKAMELAIAKTPEKETLSILPTYTAMLEVRKLVTGKKIL